MKYLFYSFFGIIILLNSACINKIQKTVSGTWTIDTIYFKGNEIRNCLLINAISFKDNNCILPITKDLCNDIIIEFIKNGKWNLIHFEKQNLLQINFDTQNQIFNGVHILRFRKDEKNKLLKMEIISDNLHLICRKALFDYDGNIDLINLLVDYSSTKK